MNKAITNIRLMALVAALFTANSTKPTSLSDAVVKPAQDLYQTVSKHFASPAAAPLKRGQAKASTYSKVKVTATKEALPEAVEPTPAQTASSIDDLATMTPDEIRAMSSQQIQTLPSAAIYKFNAMQSKAITVEHIQQLDKAQVQALQAKYLTDDQATALPAGFLLPSQAKILLPHLSHKQMSELSESAFESLPKDKLSKALSKFNTKQLESIEKKFKENNSPHLETIQHLISVKNN